MTINMWSEGGDSLLFNHTFSCQEFLELTVHEFDCRISRECYWRNRGNLSKTCASATSLTTNILLCGRGWNPNLQGGRQVTSHQNVAQLIIEPRTLLWNVIRV